MLLSDMTHVFAYYLPAPWIVKVPGSRILISTVYNQIFVPALTPAMQETFNICWEVNKYGTWPL